MLYSTVLFFQLRVVVKNVAKVEAPVALFGTTVSSSSAMVLLLRDNALVTIQCTSNSC
jgi:hypothetical protein